MDYKCDWCLGIYEEKTDITLVFKAWEGLFHFCSQLCCAEFIQSPDPIFIWNEKTNKYDKRKNRREKKKPSRRWDIQRWFDSGCKIEKYYSSLKGKKNA